MVNPHVAFQRHARWLKDARVENETDLRFMTYTQNFDVQPEGSPGERTGLSQKFPSGATLLLGILATCTPVGQPVNPFLTALQRFRLFLAYTSNQDGLVTSADGGDGATAESVFGQEGDQFPARELRILQNDVIGGTIQNVTPERLRGSLTFHCLIWKYSQ